MIAKMHHYAIENPACQYDEESLTVLQLVGRLAGKLNEVIEQTNHTQNDVDKTMSALLTEVNKVVAEYIAAGYFGDAIDQHTRDLTYTILNLEAQINARIDELAKLEEGSTTGDAELVDGRISALSETGYVSIGAHIRSVSSALAAQLRVPFMEKVSFYDTTNNISWEGNNAPNRVSQHTPMIAAKPFEVNCPPRYDIAIHYWESLEPVLANKSTYDSGWITSATIPANRPFTITMRARDNSAIYPDAIYRLRFSSAIAEYQLRHNVLDKILPTVVHGEWWSDIRYYALDETSRMVTPTPFMLDKPAKLVIDESSSVWVAMHTWRAAGENAPVVTLETGDPNHAINAKFIADSGWCKEITLPAETYITLYFKDNNAPSCCASTLINAINVETGGGDIVINGVDPVFVHPFIKSVAHRGFSSEAPENTLAAIKLAAEKGYKYVEFDVRAYDYGSGLVLLHDTTVDRTSSGTGNVYDMSIDQLKLLDFGSWKSAEYAGETIPTLYEALALCKKLGLHAYIEIKSDGGWTETDTEHLYEHLINQIIETGMTHNVSVISFATYDLSAMGEPLMARSIDDMRMGLITTEAPHIASYQISDMVNYGAPVYNNVFIDTSVTDPAQFTDYVSSNPRYPVEVFTVDDEATLFNLHPFVSGVTTNSLNAGEIIYKEAVR